MSSTRKILRAFLASPGDLQEERKAVDGVITEFNKSWADALGYQIELLGWEDTVAGFGRPQHLINPEVDRCDLFIGLMWKRWGTPPDKDGEFSSGFEEEFKRAMDRREHSKSPEIALFFRKISDESMGDPGDNLKKVLEFRKRIMTEKTLLFREFSTIPEIETLVRRKVTEYVNGVRAKDTTSEPKEITGKPADSEPERDIGEESPDSSLVSAEGFAFLKNLIDRIGRKDATADLRASDVARFRLLANSISRPGNQEMALGAHDINILFAARAEGLKLSERETFDLARLGFQYLSNENVPLWCWYSDLPRPQFEVDLVSSSYGTNDAEKVGALSVLSALAHELPTDENRKFLLGAWFSEESSARVRSAALEYLTKIGTADDYAVAKKEYDRSDSGPFRKALECMVSIHLRTGPGNSAQQLVLESQFESLDAGMLQAVLDGFENLETAELLPGLEHRNTQVRLRTLKVLLERGALDEEMAERLFGDSDASVRNEAVTLLSKRGRSFTEKEVRKILVQPQQQPSPGSDRKGEKFFAQYQMERLKKLPEEELTRQVETGHVYDDDAYFARVERYFAKHVEELRRDIDDAFKAYFEERIRRMEVHYGRTPGGKDAVEGTKNLENFLRMRFTRQGLDILCRASEYEDLQRIRGNLQSGYAGALKADAEYLGKYGEWTDILLLANVEGAIPDGSRDPLTRDEDFRREVAKAVLNVSREHSISELFSLELPAVILKKTLELCAESRFSAISNDALFGLLNHKSPDVRKAASIKAVLAFPVARIKSILREYVCGDKYRYYNVIHWLDLGASMPRDEALKVARAAAG